MLLETAKRTVESSGFLAEKAFSIAANGKAFRILIDKMYTSPHVAIVRELMTNAWDAHILANNLKPFEIHVPTTFEPHFAIRDFGCAMTHDQVMNVYSTIFESTKDARNDQVGAWGLGSKTPFAYTDTFTVQVWLDDRHRVYSVFIDAVGVPKIALALDEENDGAMTGVEVSFPVAPKDAGQFREALETVSIGFDVKPIFSTPIRVPEFETLRKGNGWQTYRYKNGSSAWLHQPLARVGCVLYPIDFSQVNAYLSSKGIRPEWRDLLVNERGFRKASMLIDFSIGGVEVTANREGLYYSDRTNQLIVDRFQAIISEMEDAFKAGIAGAATLYEANMTALKVCRSFDDVSSEVSEYLKKYARKLKFKGRKLLHSLKLTHKSKTHEEKDEKGQPIVWMEPTNFKNIEWVGYEASKFQKRSGLKFIDCEQLVWHPGETSVFVELLDDKKKWVKFSAARIRHDREKVGIHRSHELIWIRTPSLKDYGFLKMMAALGHPSYKLVNDLEKPASLQLDRSLTPIRYYDKGSREWVAFDDFDPENDAGHYVMLHRGKPVDTNRDAFSLIDTLVARKLMDDPGKVIGIPASRKSVLSKGVWTEFKPALQAAFRKGIVIKEATMRSAIDATDIEIDRRRLIELENGWRMLKRKPAEGTFMAKAFRAENRLQAIERQAEDFANFWVHRYILPREEVDKLTTEYSTLAKSSDPALVAELAGIKDALENPFTRYPLITNFWHPSSETLGQIADYIEAMDLLDNSRKMGQDASQLDKGTPTP